MLKLLGKDIYLAALEREDCRRLWRDNEYDFANPCEELNIGLSEEAALEWFADIQKKQNKENVRLGIFLLDGTPIGDVALQDIDRTNRCCSVGMGFSRLEHRGKGYGVQALRLILEHGFCRMGLERITAATLEHNVAAQRSLEKAGFLLEGRERKAVYLNGRRWDRLCYALLKEEYR